MPDDMRSILAGTVHSNTTAHGLLSETVPGKQIAAVLWQTPHHAYPDCTLIPLEYCSGIATENIIDDNTMDHSHSIPNGSNDDV